MRNASRLTHLTSMLAVSAFCLTVGSCGGSVAGLPGGDMVKTDIPDKYENYFKKCEAYEKDVEEAKKYIEETPMVLAEALDLKEGATFEEVKEAIRSRIEDEVISAGAHVEITVEGGLEAYAAAEAGTGGASAEAGVNAEVKVTITVVGEIEVSEGLQELIDAGKLALERIITSAKKLKALVAETEELISEGKKLAGSVEADIQNPATAAQVAAKLTGYVDMFGEVSALLDVSVEMNVEIKASFTAEASAEASAG